VEKREVRIRVRDMAVGDAVMFSVVVGKNCLWIHGCPAELAKEILERFDGEYVEDCNFIRLKPRRIVLFPREKVF